MMEQQTNITVTSIIVPADDGDELITLKFPK